MVAPGTLLATERIAPVPVFKTTHPYFEEALQFQLLLIGEASALKLRMVEERMEGLVTSMNALHRFRSLSFDPVQMDRPGVPPKFTMMDERVPEVITIYNCDTAYRYMSGQADKPNRVRFSRRRNPSGQPEPPRNVTMRSPDRPENLVLVIAALIGSAYEKSSDEIIRRNTSYFLTWSPQLQYFRHMRNGCFHGNRFDIRPLRNGAEPIDVNAPPTWHLYTMPDRATLNGTTVVGGHFNQMDFLPFLYDMGNMI